MHIVCPNCATSYQIASDAVGENGRSVRCVRCQEVWFATPPALAMLAAPADAAEAGAPDPVVSEFRSALDVEPPATPDPAPANETSASPSLDELTGPNAPEDAADAENAATPEPAEAEPVALADIPIPVEDAPPLVPAQDNGAPLATHSAEIDEGPPDIESVAARKARAAARRRGTRWRIPLPAAIAALVALSVGLISFRKDVVRHAPQLASFYSAIGMPVNLRGLAFANVKIGNEIHDGVPVLVVEGLIVSTVSSPVDVPRLRFALRSATGAEVYAWTAQPPQTVLEPFETLPFRSRLASPPADGQNIQVRFFTRRDAVAGLR